MTPTLTAVVGFAAWYVLLTLVLATVSLRARLGGQEAGEHVPRGRLGHAGVRRAAHRGARQLLRDAAVFVALALVATPAGKPAITGPRSRLWVLARAWASRSRHLVSTSVPAVLVRANLFFLQVLIYGWWSIRLLGVATTATHSCPAGALGSAS
jgi:uncharacterized MAPEG superfamily protein